MRRQVVGWVLAGWAVGVSGCQSWSQMGQGIPSGARVPPPGTGTYPVPSSYYNNGAGAKTGALGSNAQPAGSSTVAAGNTANARTAAQPLPSTGTGTGAPATATTANWQIPTVDQVRSGVNNTASAVFDDVGNQANQVVQAGTARAAAAVEKYTDPAPSLRPAGAPATSQPPANRTQANLAPSSSTAASSRAPSTTSSRSLSDNSPAAQEPQLDWQAPE